MDQQYLLVILTVFVGVACVALIVQAGMLFGIFKSARAIEQNAHRLMPKVESLVETSRATIEDSRKQILDISARTREILETTQKQLMRVDDVLEDATARAKVQMDRAEVVLDDAMTRAQETVAIVQGGIMKPVREIQGVAVGLRTALSFLMRGGRPDPTEATADEEMFI